MLSRSQHVSANSHGFGQGGYQSPGALADESGDRISTLAENSEQGLMARETSADGIQNKSGHNINVQTGLARHTEPKSSQHQSANSQLNHRIQTVLQRLDSMQTQNTSQQVSGLPGNGIKPSNTASGSLASLEGLPPISEPVEEIAHARRMGPQSFENRPMSPELHQSGLFQTPAWVDEIKSGLQNRFRETTAQTKSEPMVNVTIGRVEVKAIQQDSAKQPTVHNKPSGIMSLENYLKQRDRGRS